MDAETRGYFEAIRQDFAQLRGEFGEIRSEVGELRGEVGDLRGDVGARDAVLHAAFTEVRRDLADLRQRL